MTNEEKLESFYPIISRVARRVSKDYHMVETKDLEQELVCFILQRGDSLPLPSDAEWNMQSFLTRVARVYAFNQKQQHYLISSNVSYEVKDVREILQTHFWPELWDCVSLDETVEERITSHSDVAWALDRLGATEKKFVATCYTADRLPASGTKEYRKLRDLIIKICNIANHYTRAEEGSGPGRRKVVSNSRARSLIDDSGSSTY